MGLLEKLFKKNGENQPQVPVWCVTYKVRGTNPATGRNKTVEVVEASNSPTERIEEKSGLLPPYEVTDATRPASDLQLETLRKHGHKVPADLSMVDASIFITRSAEGEPINQAPAPASFFDFAIKNGVYISRYSNKKEAQDYLVAALPKLKSEIKNL